MDDTIKVSVCKDSYILKLSDTLIRPVAEFSNPDMVDETTIDTFKYYEEEMRKRG